MPIMAQLDLLLGRTETVLEPLRQDAEFSVEWPDEDCVAALDCHHDQLADHRHVDDF